MEGPTPVSALIHAATMVTAGVFLVIRCSFIFEFTPRVLYLIAIWGGITALISGLIGTAQNDIKKIIAYSTCSQLGYMILACGLSIYNIGLFHLFNHAFFKALLFLSAGSIIHILNNEQDIRKMGGLAKLSPFVYISMIIASLALAGFPFLAGYYSKDQIIESANTKF
jgi:NADH:ubiquinone oxidoreductase subunit 5 (subunit L)/multisubunit Na+/H+ antiporter MnhA subunit